MKKRSLFFNVAFTFVILCSHGLYSQTFEQWIEAGKHEYAGTSYEQLKQAENAFKKAIELKPQSAEAWYRLALTYQKMYCHEFENVENFKKNHAFQLAETYQKTLQLLPVNDLSDLSYEPDAMYINVWGRLALSYWNYNKIDSMKWAFEEMSKNYFYKTLSEMSRNTLNELEKNAILFINNENIYYYLLYNQIINQHRTDVKIIYFEGMNAVWYNVWLQNIFFPNLNISKDEIEQNLHVQLSENELFFSHHQIRTRLSFPFSQNKVIDRANWFFYLILQHNAFKFPVYTLASFDNDIMRTMINHWNIIGLTKKLFFEVPDKPYELLIQSANTWQFNELKALKGNIPNHLLRKLQFYRMPFILYAYQNINKNNHLVKTLIETHEKILPEDILPMQKDVKDFFSQIKQVVNK